MEKKFLTVPFELKESTEDEDFFFFKGYASTFGNVDHGGDMVVEGAFSNTLSESKLIPVLWQHRGSEPVGVYTSLKEDNHGLFVEGKLPKSDDFVRGRVMPQMKVGSISKMSIGYFVIDSEFAGDIRMLKELELVEISLVTFPMNNQADITGMKSFKELNEDEQLSFIAELKQFYAEKGGCPLDEKIDKAQMENVKSIRDAEDLLKNSGFSQSASKALISVIKNDHDLDSQKKSFFESLAELNK